jgi:hypothetical protein
VSIKSGRLKILVLGYIVRGPLGGMVWSNLNFLKGLARLGHDVYFMEDSADYPSCYDPVRCLTSENADYGLEFARKTLQQIGFGERWAYYDAHTQQWFGPCSRRAVQMGKDADLLLNLCGVNPLRPWWMPVPRRVLVDEDPAFTQIRHLTDPAAKDQALLHNAFFTFAENVGKPGCTLPDDGLPWRATRQPVVLEDIVPEAPNAQARWTTVMQWESYPPRVYNGVRYGLKADAFSPLLDLPAKTGEALELALGSAGAPRAMLRRQGWHLCDPFEVTRDPWIYERYVRGSKAEFGVAKHGYVLTRSGWFSERSACYLAHGRPVLHQETGFTDWLQTPGGLIAFADAAEAAAGIEAIRSRYAFHCKMARQTAEIYFDSARVLSRLIEEAHQSPASVATAGRNA